MAKVHKNFICMCCGETYKDGALIKLKLTGCLHLMCSGCMDDGLEISKAKGIEDKLYCPKCNSFTTVEQAPECGLCSQVVDCSNVQALHFGTGFTLECGHGDICENCNDTYILDQRCQCGGSVIENFVTPEETTSNEPTDAEFHKLMDETLSLTQIELRAAKDLMRTAINETASNREAAIENLKALRIRLDNHFARVIKEIDVSIKPFETLVENIDDTIATCDQLYNLNLRKRQAKPHLDFVTKRTKQLTALCTDTQFSTVVLPDIGMLGDQIVKIVRPVERLWYVTPGLKYHVENDNDSGAWKPYKILVMPARVVSISETYNPDELVVVCANGEVIRYDMFTLNTKTGEYKEECHFYSTKTPNAKRIGPNMFAFYDGKWRFVCNIPDLKQCRLIEKLNHDVGITNVMPISNKQFMIFTGRIKTLVQNDESDYGPPIAFGNEIENFQCVMRVPAKPSGLAEWNDLRFIVSAKGRRESLFYQGNGVELFWSNVQPFDNIVYGMDNIILINYLDHSFLFNSVRREHLRKFVTLKNNPNCVLMRSKVDDNEVLYFSTFSDTFVYLVQ